MKFTKMQGIGNDYVYLNCITEKGPEDPAGLAVKISNRHFGVGSDGLVLICPSERADFRMRMYNADGSEAEMCGNASRCVGKYLYERGFTDKKEITLETGAGIKILKLNLKGNKVDSVEVDMGIPCLKPSEIPFSGCDDMNTAVNVPLTVDGREFRVTCVSMGNPHCVVFQDDVDTWPVEQWGPKFERHPLFPRRTNTEFVRIIDRKTIRMRVWERGSGETLACGTGACATLAAAVLNGLTERSAVLRLNGGELTIRWDEATGHIYMTGPAVFVFDGDWN